MKRVEGKVVLITGGGNGFGKDMCYLLAIEGAKVVVADIDLAAAEKTAKSILDAGGIAVAAKLDVTSEKSWENTLGITLDQFGQLDVLVNNAGIHKMGELIDTSLEDWRTIFNVNLDGAFLGVRSAVKVMRNNQGNSSIINIASVAAFVGDDTVAYSTSKGGMRMLSKSCAVECGKSGYDIRVNTIFPGAINGGMPQVERSDKWVEGFYSLVPLGRAGKSEDIAQGVLFLASDDSNFVNGSELVIDGGMTLTCGIGLLNTLAS